MCFAGPCCRRAPSVQALVGCIDRTLTDGFSHRTHYPMQQRVAWTLLLRCLRLTAIIVSLLLDHSIGKVPAPDEEIQGPGTPAYTLKGRVGRCRDGVYTMLMQIQTSGRGKTYAHPITLLSTM
jgi:hypothetical protein